MVCPRCNQGNIHHCLIKKSQMKILLCSECEAMWFDAPAIGTTLFLDFNSYMIKEGMEPLWDELEVGKILERGSCK